MMAKLVTYLALAIVAIQSSAFAEPRTRENAKGITIEVLNINSAPGDPCNPGEFEGVIVKREFADDAVTLSGITVEHEDGTREIINVEVPSDMNMALRGRVFDGLQRLSKVGRHATGRLFYCGAAGRFLQLDAIR
jgi:hypothetical protein